MAYRSLKNITADEIDHVLKLVGLDFSTLWTWKAPTTLKRLTECQAQAQACGEPSSAVETWKSFLDANGKPLPSLSPDYAAYFMPRVIGGAHDAIIVIRLDEQTFFPKDRAPVTITGARVMLIGPGFVLDNGAMCTGATDALIDYMRKQELISSGQALFAYRYSIAALEQVIYDQTCLLYEADAVPLDCRELSLQAGHQIVDRFNEWANGAVPGMPGFKVGDRVLIGQGVTRALIGDGLISEEGETLDGAEAEVVGIYPHQVHQQLRYKVAIDFEVEGGDNPSPDEADCAAAEGEEVVQRFEVHLPAFCLQPAQ